MGSRNKVIFSTIALAGIVIMGGYLRITRISESPPSVNWDEAALGYNSLALFKTGRDEFGKKMPLSLRSFDDYKPALYSYLTTGFVAGLGLNELSTRLTSIASGLMLIALMYYLATKLTGRPEIGLTAGLLIATSPWAVHFSRIAFEANLACMLYFAGIACFVAGLTKPKYGYISVFLMVLSMYAYHAQRAIALPTLVLLGLVFKPKVKIGWLLVAVVGLLPLGISSLVDPIGARLTATNIFRLWPFVPLEFNAGLIASGYSLVWMVVGHYLAYLSPVNLFWQGSVEPILRMPHLGLFVTEALPLFIAGWIVLPKQKALAKLIICLAVLTPLPGVITWNWFSVVRSLAVYPTWTLVMATGAVLGFESIRGKLAKISALTLTVVVFGISCVYSMASLILYYPVETYGDFQPGFEKSAPYLVGREPSVREIVFDSPHIAPYIFVLFYGKYPPGKYFVEAGLDRKNSGTEDYVFGKWQFRKIDPKFDFEKRNVILVGSVFSIPDYKVEELKRDGKLIKLTDFPDAMGYTSLRAIEL